MKKLFIASILACAVSASCMSFQTKAQWQAEQQQLNVVSHPELEDITQRLIRIENQLQLLRENNSNQLNNLAIKCK